MYIDHSAQLGISCIQLECYSVYVMYLLLLVHYLYFPFSPRLLSGI